MRTGWRHVQQQVHSAWNGALEHMGRMSRTASVRPRGAMEVFRINQSSVDSAVDIEAGPVVFNVPERANKSSANLYIVVRGWVQLKREGGDAERLRSAGFGTKVAYFRQKQQKWEHIYGAHYDMSENVKSHPVFHLQMDSRKDDHEVVEKEFRRSGTVTDFMRGISRTVRVPTAQMDVFSVFAQIMADHLIWENSAAEVEREFGKAQNFCSFFDGAGHAIGGKQTKDALQCGRSLHWYVDSK